MTDNSEIEPNVIVPSVSYGLDEITWNDWSNEGESRFLRLVATMVKNSPPGGLENILDGHPKAIYELFYHCINGPLTVDQVNSTVTQFLFWNIEIPSIIVDILMVLQMDLTNYDSSAKQKFISLCKSLSKLVPITLFKERYELEALSELEIFPAKNFCSKFIKVRTRLYYKQNRFNMLREEMEGFSKLIVGIFNQRSYTNGKFNLVESKDLLLSLCGWFNLDPARVLDVVLDLFETNIEDSTYFIPLIADLVKKSQVLLEVLLFRYSRHFIDGTTSRSLHEVVVQLINNDLLSFEDIFKSLEPSDDEILREIDSKSEVSAELKISLTSKKSNTEEEVSEDFFELNQKLSFCEVLITNGRWDLFLKVLTSWNHEYYFQQLPIARATCFYLHILIDPLYDRFSGLGPKVHRKKLVSNFKYSKIQPATNWNEFVTTIVPIILNLGPSLHFDSTLIFKLSRLLVAANSKSCTESNTSSDVIEKCILNIIEKSLLPALSHLESNCCVAEIIWDVLKMFNVSVRYCMYSHWKEYCLKCPAIMKKKPQTLYSIRACLKKVSKENVKPMGRIMGKLSHYAPAELCEQIVYQIQMYDNLIGPIVESLKYLNNLAYDLLGFVIVEALRNDPNSRPKHDGNSPMPWFCNTASFCATLLKKYPIDISGILKYVMEELLNKNYIVLMVLKEILHKMTGIEITDEMTDDQIEALGGGECLRGEAAYYVPLRSMKKSANRLKDALIQEDILSAMAIIIAQLKYNIVFDEDQDFHLKFLGKLYDECHDTLLQFGTFIAGTALEESDIEFPSLETLVLDYHITHEASFFLCRQFLIYKGKLNANVIIPKSSKVKANKAKDVKSEDEIGIAEKLVASDLSNSQGSVNEKLVPKQNQDVKELTSGAELTNSNTKEKEELIPNKTSDSTKNNGNENTELTAKEEPLAKDLKNVDNKTNEELKIEKDSEDFSDTESWGIGEESFEIPSGSKDDFSVQNEKEILLNKMSESDNMEMAEDCLNSYDWDADDKKTWIQHNNENSESSPSSNVNNKIVHHDFNFLGDSSDYMDEDDDSMSSEKEVFDIPQIFDGVSDSSSISVDLVNNKVSSNTNIESGKIKNTRDSIENSNQISTECIEISDSEDDGKDPKKDVKSNEKVQGKPTHNSSENSGSKDVTIISDKSEENTEDDWAKEKKLKSSHSNSSKLVNILLDWVLPSVLSIQESTSFITEEISPYASAVFWTLTIYDIHAPVDVYDKEIAKLKTALTSNEQNKDTAASKAKKEHEKINLLMEKLAQEKKIHVMHVKSVLQKLDETKNEWFAAQVQKNAKNELINVLLHSCILPRVLFSAMDAVYCAKFILMLHQLQIENFSTVLCYDRLLCDIKNLVALCSENEASRFGRFLCAVLSDLMRFHSSQDIYNAECANTPGFITKFRSSTDRIDSDKVHYENFRHLCHKWHFKITKALLCLLDSKEYVLIRNSIIVLKKILPKFPVILKLAQCIEKKISKIKQEEKDNRQDLHALAMSYWGQLMARMPNMIDEGEFHLIDDTSETQSSQDMESENNEANSDSNNPTNSQPINEEVSSDEDKSDDDKDFEEVKDDDDIPLSKTSTEEKKKSSDNSKNDNLDGENKNISDDDKKAKCSNSRQSSKDNVRPSSRTTAANSKVKRSHSETIKKDSRSKSSEGRKTRKKHKSKSRSKSVESDGGRKEKKTKLKREYVSPEAKKVRKKEKKSSKRKDHESPDLNADKKHKISNNKSKRYNLR